MDAVGEAPRGERRGGVEPGADLVGQPHGQLGGHRVADGRRQVVGVGVARGVGAPHEPGEVEHVPLVAVPRDGRVLRHLQGVDVASLARQGLSAHGPEPSQDAGPDPLVVQVEPVVVAGDVDAPHRDAGRGCLPLAPERRQRVRVGGQDAVEDPPGAGGDRRGHARAVHRRGRAPGPLRERHRLALGVLEPALGAQQIEDVAEEHQIEVRGPVASPRHLRRDPVDLAEREREDLGSDVARSGGAVAEVQIGDEREHGFPPETSPVSR